MTKILRLAVVLAMQVPRQARVAILLATFLVFIFGSAAIASAAPLDPKPSSQPCEKNPDKKNCPKPPHGKPTKTQYTFSDPDFNGLCCDPGEQLHSTIGCDTQGQRPGPDRLIDYSFNPALTVDSATRRSFTTLDGYTSEYIEFDVTNKTDTYQPVDALVSCENTSP